ncbi:hypothetical protein KFE25_007566 [Diacronema lutheri]|uniref:Uncharacterized protein n=1 Tax=Diacronema lutheri TaxID=2081491 RepID=A0A8J5XPE5_DIALT|nr:hypothetical protein KFE25_007566 [Diacronema lutheri]
MAPGALDEHGFAIVRRAEMGALAGAADGDDRGWGEEIDALARDMALETRGFEVITSARLQLVFRRNALSPVLLRVVAQLERALRAAKPDIGPIALMDCYVLRTCDGCKPDAFRPQEWHLDSIEQFPVAAVLLRGEELTNFARGPYVDLSEGVPPERIREWAFEWRGHKGLDSRGGSGSEAELAHWQRVLPAAGLATPDGSGRLTVDWAEQLEPAEQAAPAGRGGTEPGDVAFFFANKAHRGPATRALAAGSPPPTRDVLFVSWAAGRVRVPRSVRQSETDFTVFGWHLELKLRLTARAQRQARRLADMANDA